MKELFRTALNKRRINVVSNTKRLNELARLYSHSLGVDEASAFEREKLVFVQLAALSAHAGHFEHLATRASSAGVNVEQLDSLKCVEHQQQLYASLHTCKTLNTYEILLKNNKQLVNEKFYDQYVNEFKLQSIRLARKQLNYNLAVRLLGEYIENVNEDSRATAAPFKSVSYFCFTFLYNAVCNYYNYII